MDSYSISEANVVPMLAKNSLKVSANNLSSEIVVTSSIFSWEILFDFLFLPKRSLISSQLCPGSLDVMHNA
jgi:hypothetical protein